MRVTSPAGTGTASGKPPEKLVIGVLLRGEGRSGGQVLLLISAAEQDQAMQRLHAEAVFDELIGEPVEELGMSGTAAHAAKIVRGGDDAGSEMILPDAIDHHARRQRIRRFCNPFGE